MYRICLVLFFVVVSPVFIGCGVFDFLRGDSDEHTKTATVKRDQIQEEIDQLRAENTDLKKRIDLLKNEGKSSMDETIREMAKVEDEQKTLNQELAKLREENKRIKQGYIPEEWYEVKRRQKDTDARWTKKNGQNYYGYKNHICVDNKHKLIRDYAVSDAAVHDSQMFDQLIDESNSSRDVYADSAYRSKESVEGLKKRGFREHLQRKGCRHRKLTEREQRGNRTRARTRSRVEHIFGVQAMMAGGLILRTIGIVRARAKIGLLNLAYNMNRYSMLGETG